MKTEEEPRSLTAKDRARLQARREQIESELQKLHSRYLCPGIFADPVAAEREAQFHSTLPGLMADLEEERDKIDKDLELGIVNGHALERPLNAWEN